MENPFQKMKHCKLTEIYKGDAMQDASIFPMDKVQQSHHPQISHFFVRYVKFERFYELLR